MSEAPERIWAVPEYNCTVYMSGNSPITAQTGPFEHHRHGKAAAYVRADLSDALLREAVDALGMAVDDLDEWVACGDSLTKAGFNMDGTADCAERARATLAKLRAHLGEDK